MVPTAPSSGLTPCHPFEHIASRVQCAVLARLLAANRDQVLSTWYREFERIPELRSNAYRWAMAEHAWDAYLEALDPGSLSGFKDLYAHFEDTATKPIVVAAALNRVLSSFSLAAFPILVDGLDGSPNALHQATNLVLESTQAGAMCVARAAEAAVAGECSRVRRKHVRFAREVARVATGNRLRLVDVHEIPTPVGPGMRIREARDGARLRHAALAAAYDLRLDEGRAEDLALAVGEAVANVLKHAGEGVAYVWQDGRRVFVLLEDDGDGIALEVLPQALSPGWSSEPSLGMGFTLMLEMADTLWLSTGSFGTRLCIEKGLPECPARTAETLLSETLVFG